MKDTLRVVFILAVACNLTWCCLNYYGLLLGEGKRQIISTGKRLAITGWGVITGVATVAATYFFDLGSISIVITAMMFIGSFIISKAELVPRIIVILATLINASGAYVVMFAVSQIFFEAKRNPISVAGIQHVTGMALLASTILAGYLLNAKSFPNGVLSEVIKTKGARKYLLIYMMIFSAVDVISVKFFVQAVFSTSYDGLNKAFVIASTAIYGLMVTVCGYLIVFYICKNHEAEQKSLLLEAHLKREMDFRNNIYSGAFMVFCVNLTKNTFEEGHESFTEAVAKRDGEYCFTDTIRLFMENCLYHDDYNKIKPFADIKKIRDLFKIKPTYTTQARVSVGQTRKYFKSKAATIMSEMYDDNQWLWFEIRFTNTKDEDKGIEYVYVTFYNVDKKVNIERTLKHEATTDALTGLLNRREFEQRVKQSLALERNRGILYYIDMDAFKDINDRFGHPEGDRVLIRVSDVLRDLFRTHDIIGRIGGDEFAVFVKGKSDAQSIDNMAKKINDEIKNGYETRDGEDISPSVSIGIAIAPLHGTSFQELYENADRALYDAKDHGKDRHAIFSA